MSRGKICESFIVELHQVLEKQTKKLDHRCTAPMQDVHHVCYPINKGIPTDFSEAASAIFHQKIIYCHPVRKRIPTSFSKSA
jgi:hypothetical protein